MANYTASLLEAALLGYQQRKAEIDAKMAEIQEQLKGRGSAQSAPATGGETRSAAAPRKGRRKMSAAGKAHIIAALKKRWAAFHKAQAAAKTTGKAAPKKQTSPARKSAFGKSAPSTSPRKATRKAAAKAPARRKTAAKKSASGETAAPAAPSAAQE